MKVIKKVSDMQKIAFKHLMNEDEIGLVPTMGALHEGHVSLINKSVREDDITVVSIFVNPTQFGPNEDYLKYPRPFDRDLKICKANHVDYVFAPSAQEMYGQNHKTFVEVKDMQDILCGQFRKKHFRGVATVVSKLFNITFCERAYFGVKDFQQLKIIEKMVKDLNFRTKIVPCPIVREKSGLALSSRNSYLSETEKKQAAAISKALKEAKEEFKNKSISQVVNTAVRKIKGIAGSRIDYAQILDYDTLETAGKDTRKAVFVVAVWVGKTRLIDNIMIKKKE